MKTVIHYQHYHLNKIEEALVLVNESLSIIQRQDNQAKILFVIFEQLYNTIAKEQGLGLIEARYDEQNNSYLNERLKIFFD